MELDIQPHNPINKASFRLGGQRLAKSNSRNCFFARQTKYDLLYTTWVVVDGQKKQIKTAAENRNATKLVSRNKAYWECHLADEGAKLFREIHDTLGAFDFCFYIDIDDPLPTVPQKTVAIDELIKGYILEIGLRISVLK